MKSSTHNIPKANGLGMNSTNGTNSANGANGTGDSHWQDLHSPNTQINYKIEMSLLIQQIERFLKIPVSVISTTTATTIDEINNEKVIREISIDCSILSCGCLISEELANSLSINSKLICPNCHQNNTYLLSPLNEFRELTSFIKNFKSEFNNIKGGDNNNNNNNNNNTELTNDINSDVILEDSKRVSVVKSTINRRRRSSSRKSNKDSQILNGNNNQQVQQVQQQPILQQSNSNQSIPNNQTNKTSNFTLLTAFHEILTEVDKNSTSSTSPTNTKILPKLQQQQTIQQQQQQQQLIQQQPIQKTRTSISELSSSAHNSIQTSIESNGNLTEYTKLIQQDGNLYKPPQNNENINHSRSPINRSIIYQNNDSSEINNNTVVVSTTTNNELISNGSRKLSLIQSTQSNLTKGLQRLSSNISISNNTNTNNTNNNISNSPSDSFFNHSINFKRESSNTTTTKSSSSSLNNNTNFNNNENENDKELLYAKNFPFYRKLYQYNTHQSKIFLKNKLSKIFINTSISYDLTKMCLLSEKKWEVYKINPNKPELSPILICCGNKNGDYGINFDNLNKISKNEILKNSNFQKINNNNNNNNQIFDSLNNWEHLICKISLNYLIIAGTRGFLRIIDLNDNGKLLYTYQSKFPIRSIDFSNDEKLISVAVTGKDKYSSFEQPFIILLKLEIIESENSEKNYYFQNIDDNNNNNDDGSGNNLFKNNFTLSPISTNKTISKLDNNDDPNEMFDGMFNFSSILPKTSNMKFINSNNKSKDNSNNMKKDSGITTTTVFLKVSSYPFTLPYRDPINTLQFSPNSEYLICSTALESRFIEINIIDPMKPKLIMKSQRKLDTSLDSEGITDIQFFPDNRLISLTSVAYNANPIIIDSKITSINNGNNGPDAIVKPKLLARIEEVGTTIHKTVISPRGDAVGFLDRNGDVYLLSTPRIDDNDTKRLVILTTVSSAYRVRESACMRFDKDGYKLFILDRKGVLTIADFTAGTIEDHNVTRSKIIG